MKIAILTLKFHSNFGFLMQAFAMQKVVRKLGHEAYHFYIKEETVSIKKRLVLFFKKLIRNIISGANYSLFPYYPTNADREVKDKYTWDFIKKNIQLTPYIPSLTTRNAKNIPIFDAYIVGSDQVWRREFTDDILCYFFNFVPENTRKMSYAASFGKDNVTYSRKTLEECKKLLKSFDYITVREDDGVRICREFFNTDSTKVVDPTLLLSKDDYLSLIDDDELPLCEDPYIFIYILRPSKEKSEFINRFSHDRNMKVINIMPQKLEIVGKAHLDECIYPSISKWLKGFSQAAFVITDSFHASVFSIIFHKQFYVVNDKNGGITRIPSLLKSLDINGRYSHEYKGNVVDINFNNIDSILNKQREFSMSILSSFLNK